MSEEFLKYYNRELAQLALYIGQKGDTLSRFMSSVVCFEGDMSLQVSPIVSLLSFFSLYPHCLHLAVIDSVLWLIIMMNFYSLSYGYFCELPIIFYVLKALKLAIVSPLSA